MANKLLLIDGNSIMNRAFFGIRELTTSKGIHTNGIFGFLNIFFKMIEEEEATHCVVAFDVHAPTFRHKMYDAYKGNRKGMPDELREQMPLIKTVLAKMNISICEMAGFEADDILGTLAYKGEAEGYQVTILSGDRDMLQTATKAIKVSIPKTSKGQTSIESYHDKEVKERYLVTPQAFIDVKGLMGDSSDNIPGVKGVGEKTATKLIAKYGSMEALYEHLDEVKGSVHDKLEVDKDSAFMSKELATIKLDVEVPLVLDDAKIEGMFNEEAYHEFKQLELKSFFTRFEHKEIQEETVFAPAEYVEDLGELEEAISEADQITYYLYNDKSYKALICLIDDFMYYVDSDKFDISIMSGLVQSILSIDGQVVTYNLKQQLHDLDISVRYRGVLDCALIAYLINPNKDTYGIDDLVSEYLGKSYKTLEEVLGKGKSKKSMAEIDKQSAMDYLSAGVHYLSEVFEDMTDELESKHMEKLYHEIELPLLFVLKSMESTGVLIDQEALKTYQSMLADKVDNIQKEIYEQAGETFNINSPKQLGVILFERLELPVIKKTKTGYSTAVDVLEKLKDKHPIINMVMEYRTVAKLKSTYADGLFNYIADDGRIHTTYSQKTAATGRLSSIDPNLQNIPVRMPIGREIRKVFIPEKGYEFVDADYSQIELRLLAHLSEDETFIKAFNDNEDIHRITAAKVFDVPYEEVTDDIRRNAKAVNFGIVYGISAFGLSQDLDISVKEASGYIDDYFEKYPKVKAFLDVTVAEAKAYGYTETMYGRIRPIPELSSSNFMQRSFGERIAMNTPIQGSAADIMKIAMIRVFNRLEEEKLDAKLILQVHDELIIEAKADIVDKIKQLLTEEMEAACQLSVPLIAEAHSGHNWYEAK